MLFGNESFPECYFEILQIFLSECCSSNFLLFANSNLWIGPEWVALAARRKG